MQITTESRVITLAINLLLESESKRELSDVIIDRSRKLAMFKEDGWKVFFIFKEENQFLKRTMTVEVTNSGAAKIFESM